MPYRYVWPAELDLMARIAGMRLRERWSGGAASRSPAKASRTCRCGRRCPKGDDRGGDDALVVLATFLSLARAVQRRAISPAGVA